MKTTSPYKENRRKDSDIIGGKEIRIYIRNPYTKKPAVTVVTVMVDENTFYRGVAICLDNPCKKEGYNKALGRANKAFSISEMRRRCYKGVDQLKLDIVNREEVKTFLDYLCCVGDYESLIDSIKVFGKTSKLQARDLSDEEKQLFSKIRNTNKG